MQEENRDFLDRDEGYGVSKYVCDAEYVRDNFYISHGKEFAYGATQSDEHSYDGQYSCKLEKGKEYGMTINFDSLQAGEVFEASCWVYGLSNANIGVLCAQGSGGFKYFRSNAWDQDNILDFSSKDTAKLGWVKLCLKVRIEGDVSPDATLSFFVKLPNEENEIYCDNFIITRYALDNYEPKQIPDGIEVIRLKIDSSEYEKIKDKRESAFKRGLLTDNDKWTNAQLQWGNDSLAVSIRLKGDWLDHLEKQKWSFRVKSEEKTEYWRGMKTFSLQSAHTRHYLDEWVWHKMLEAEGVLTPRYDFVFLSINDEKLGVYAVEEHFTKHLVEHKSRREGPILKLDEGSMWHVKERVSEETFTDIPFMASSVIKPFGEKKLKKKPQLMANYEIAQNLVFQYKYGLKTPDEIFDIDQLAKYFALTELTRAYHAFIWHNQRFYYNPILSKLEPIAFDGFTDKGEFSKELPFLLENAHQNNAVKRVFDNEAFRKLYATYLKKYSNEQWVLNFFKRIESDLKVREQQLQLEYNWYAYNRNFVVDNAAKIRATLQEDRTSAPPQALHEDTIKAPFDIVEGVSIVAYQSKKGKPVHIQNFHNRDVEIVGFRAKGEDHNVEPPVLIPAYFNHAVPANTVVKTGKKVEEVIFKQKDSPKLYRSPIVKLPIPKNYAPVQAINDHSFANTAVEGVVVKGHDVVFKGQKIRLLSPFVVPEGYHVKFEKGASIDLINNALFLSYSPITMLGTAQDKVKIMSSDSTAKGFSVLNPKGDCQLSHVDFENITPLDYNGWTLTGCITFYKTNVALNNVRFLHTNGEDALNLVRCNFEMNACTFNGAKSDAFDGDFCVGTVTNSNFDHVGNDALDFSGSTIAIRDVTTKHIGDKGISCGEASTIDIENVTIAKANLGIASKDKSVVTAKKVALESVKVGYLAYQKKPEFGGAMIQVSSSTSDNINELHIIAPGSTLILEGDTIIGNAHIPEDLF